MESYLKETASRRVSLFEGRRFARVCPLGKSHWVVTRVVPAERE